MVAESEAEAALRREVPEVMLRMPPILLII